MPGQPAASRRVASVPFGIFRRGLTAAEGTTGGRPDGKGNKRVLDARPTPDQKTRRVGARTRPERRPSRRVSIAMEAPSSPMLDDRTIEARPSRVCPLPRTPFIPGRFSAFFGTRFRAEAREPRRERASERAPRPTPPRPSPALTTRRPRSRWTSTRSRRSTSSGSLAARWTTPRSRRDGAASRAKTSPRGTSTRRRVASWTSTRCRRNSARR